MTFTHLAIHGHTSNTNCSRSFVEIRDGDSLDSPLKTRICEDETPPSIVSQGSALYVRAKKQYFSLTLVFRAVYSEATSGNAFYDDR